MTFSKTPIYFAALISLLALIVAAVALYNAGIARQIALSQISVEERNSLATPVFDQQKGTWSYLAIYEVSVNNLGGPDITLDNVSKVSEGAGFLVLLRGQEIVNSALNYKAFLVKPTIGEIRANPKLIKTVAQTDIGAVIPLNLLIKNGESKTIRLGVLLDAYDKENKPIARVVLLSYRFNFSNGKSYLFRRGFPIQPLKDVAHK
ncbi:MAG: hypothetical protein GXO75_13470 [Calditrichaeota bacterium]|nr:hypothetical protein [Calditrichota bacterium]